MSDTEQIQWGVEGGKGKRLSSLRACFWGIWLAAFTLPAFAEYSLEVQELGSGVYALVGELDQRSPENYANNSTHGVIVTSKGVVVIDPGGSYLGAKQIHEEIKRLTDQSVVLVVNTRGQDHRWLGNGYFKELGARIVTSQAAYTDQHARADYHMKRLDALIGAALDGTVPVYADEQFEAEKKVDIGGVDIELHHLGAAHTLGDSFVWLPQQKILFSGDIVFVERALGTGPARNVKSWIQVFEKMAAYQPEILVPGHGHATGMDTATKDTYDYLRCLYDEISRMLDEGLDIQDATNLDQSRFSYLEVFEGISRKNAQNLYEQLKFNSF